VCVELKVVGDIFLKTKSQNNTDPFYLLKDTLRKSDIVFGNLETTVTKCDAPRIEKAVSLRTDPENLSFLNESKFSIVNLAHNHILDYGEDGAMETMEHLQKTGISHIGIGRDIQECTKEVGFKIKDKTIAFIGFYMEGISLSTTKICIADANEQLIRFRISELTKKYDFVIVSLHWGTENVFYPSPEQQSLARACIDEGASVIIGHHPHRLQGIEKYRNGIIFYSLGNFNFMPCGVRLSPYPNLSCIANITLRQDNTIHYSLTPVEIDKHFNPTQITAEEYLIEFEKHMSAISEPSQDEINKWWWFGEIAKPYLLENGKSFCTRIRRYGIKHLCQMLCWFVSPFVIKCYIGILFRLFRKIASLLINFSKIKCFAFFVVV
jgi:hypothetical protein